MSQRYPITKHLANAEVARRNLYNFRMSVWKRKDKQEVHHALYPSINAAIAAINKMLADHRRLTRKPKLIQGRKHAR